jgi:sugar phosphate isomerase/epimerase
MKLPGALGHLTYCLNIHPTQGWAEARAALTGPVAAVRRALLHAEEPSSPDSTGQPPVTLPDAPVEPGHDEDGSEAPGFAVGLRFSAEAVQDLADPAARADLKAIIARHGYLPVTMNGFPYGPFHGTRVKEEVYQPDWTRPERLDYTLALAELMAELNPPKGSEPAFVSLSTVPGTFKPLATGREAEMAAAILRTAAALHGLRARTGVTVALALEPEPFCFLETIDEAVDFFDLHLFSEAAVATLAGATGLTRAEAAAALPRHLGLCYDVCHAAVEFEDPAASLAALRAAGVPVHKLQLSAALRVPAVDAAARARLAAFDEPTYLHQVVSRRPGGLLRREPDLGPALARADSDGEEWRVHFHVPLFVAEIPPFATTQGFLAEILALHRADPISPHLEVETYSWGVLPPELRGASIEADIARELAWVLERLDAGPCP